MKLAPNNLTKQMSVVMITRNRINALRQTLSMLSSLNEKFNIIVVDNASTDNTSALIKQEFPEVKVIPLAKNMGALGRNIGVEAATTPYIAFSDDDSWWEDGALTKAIKYFEEYPKLGVIAGTVLVNQQRKLDPTSALQSVSPLESRENIPGKPVLGFLGCAIIVRTGIFKQVGGYSPHMYFGGEEEMLAWDVAASGWGISYCEDIIAYHYPSSSRDLAFRVRLSTRNKILRAWLRRPISLAIKKTLIPALDSREPSASLLGWLQAVASIPGMIAHRKEVPGWLEAQIVELENQNQQLAARAAQKQKQFARDMRWEANLSTK